jgi:hypothetical protein
MEAKKLLDGFRDAGLSLLLLPGGKIKVTPVAKITDKIRQEINVHKGELITLLSSPPGQQRGDTIPENAAVIAGPPNTPAICTNCERLEIVEIMGKPVPGCLYTAPGEYPDGWRRLPDSLKKCMWPGTRPQRQVSDRLLSQDNKAPAIPAKEKTKPSPHALKWLRDHKVVLRLAGWTAPELYRRNKSRGLAWIALWGNDFLEVTLDDDGVIVFRFKSVSDRTITQTARPMKRKSWRQHGTAN